MTFEINTCLQKFNTFGFKVTAEQSIWVKNQAELLSAMRIAHSENKPWRVLGGGSNVVLTQDLPGITLMMRIPGKKLLRETPTHWIIEAGAGENWHDFVAWTLDQGWPGLENLALIPGTCGAAPIQNIGAYGLEVGQYVESVEALDTSILNEANPWVRISGKECEFSYRDSLFKRIPNRYIVTQVNFAIPKVWQANLSYTELAKKLSGLEPISAQAIFKCICDIRRSKLPDPDLLGNAGSFFHNPVVDENQLIQMKQQFPNLVFFATDSSQGQARYKIAAGWLIDQCGFKGYRQGNVGVYSQQALVLVNHGGGHGKELLALAQTIKEKIHAKFGVDLTQEPVVFP